VLYVLVRFCNFVSTSTPIFRLPGLITKELTSVHFILKVRLGKVRLG